MARVNNLVDSVMFRGPRFVLDKVFFCELLGSICTVSCIVSMLSIAAAAVNRYKTYYFTF